MNYTQIEHECDPSMGDMGRGTVIPFEDFMAMDIPGYTPYRAPAKDGEGQLMFQVYGASGAPSCLWWRGFVRKGDGKCYVVAFEASSMSDPNPTKPVQEVNG